MFCSVKLFVVTVTAGIGGTAILENYINGKALIEPESLAEQSQQIAKTAVDALDSYQKAGPSVLSQINANALSNQLSELQKTSKLRKCFRG